MKRIIGLTLTLLFLLTGSAFAASVNLMSVDELKSELGSKDLVILDARSGRDWSTSEFKIPGAVRASSSEFASWSDNFEKGQKIVLYCA